MKLKTTWGDAVQKCLPGDHIHYVAPSNQRTDTRAVIEAVDAARLKRMRKLAKRRKHGL